MVKFMKNMLAYRNAGSSKDPQATYRFISMLFYMTVSMTVEAVIDMIYHHGHWTGVAQSGMWSLLFFAGRYGARTPKFQAQETLTDADNKPNKIFIGFLLAVVFFVCFCGLALIYFREFCDPSISIVLKSALAVSMGLCARYMLVHLQYSANRWWQSRRS